MGSDQDEFLQLSEQALLEVLEALEDAEVDPEQQKIIWSDGARLSLEQTVRRIHSQSMMPFAKIESHVVGWLELIYDPPDLNDEQLEEFETLIERWIAPYDEAL